MKHAYLILAHGSFGLLQRLLSCIDDERNDIYIHYDKKCGNLPQLEVKRSRLYILPLEERVAVYWGDISVVKAEFALFAAAKRHSSYAYYHLLSGVDLPLKSQDYVHAFCSKYQGKQFIGFYSGKDLEQDLERKMQRYHLFPQAFRGSGLVWQGQRIARGIFIRLQECCGIYRNKSIHFAKGTQWLSITDNLVEALLRDQSQILRIYNNTFCADEVAIQTYVRNSPYWEQVFDVTDEARSSMRCIGWRDGVLYDFQAEDYAELAKSTALFARKFNEKDLLFLNQVISLSRDEQ